jgi:hypothetical protein
MIFNMYIYIYYMIYNHIDIYNLERSITVARFVWCTVSFSEDNEHSLRRMNPSASPYSPQLDEFSSTFLKCLGRWTAWFPHLMISWGIIHGTNIHNKIHILQFMFKNKPTCWLMIKGDYTTLYILGIIIIQ